MSARHPLVAVYADESCLGNGKEGENPGGAGMLVEYRHPDGRLTRRDLWVSEPATTNNRMALRSVIEAFDALGAKGQRFSVQFTSDSKYIIDGLTSWIFGWKRNGWKRKTGAIENLELWMDVLRATQGHEYAWRWVRGHAGHPQNEWANALATRAAADQTRSGGLVPSGFDEWYASRAGQRTAKGDLSPFPDGDTFRASSSLPHPG